MKGTSYKLTKKKKIFCLTILFFTAIFILMAIFCFSVYREDQKIVEKEISVIEASQKNQKLKPKLDNQTQHFYDTFLPELSSNLPTITTLEGSILESGCHEAVQAFRDIPRVSTSLDGISLDYINNLYIYFSTTSLAYSKILNECLNDKTKQMIESKNYDMDVLRRLINYMLSKETFGIYIDNVLVLHSLLKSLKEDINYKQSFFLTYEKQLKTFDDALNKIVLFVMSKKEALLRLLEYTNNQDNKDLTKVTKMLEDGDKKREFSIFTAFMKTVQVIPVIIMESTLKDFFNIDIEKGSNKVHIKLKGKYEDTPLGNKIGLFKETAYRMIWFFFDIFRKMVSFNTNKDKVGIGYNEIDIYELSKSICEVKNEFTGSLKYSLKHSE